jgi:hypothetical protein
MKNHEGLKFDIRTIKKSMIIFFCELKAIAKVVHLFSQRGMIIPF